MNRNWDDTIAALATPAGTGAISLIRISGPHAFGILSSISPRSRPEERKSHSAFLSRIYREKEILDEALVTLFKSPASFNPDIALGECELKEKCKAYTQNSEQRYGLRK